MSLSLCVWLSLSLSLVASLSRKLSLFLILCLSLFAYGSLSLSLSLSLFHASSPSVSLPLFHTSLHASSLSFASISVYFSFHTLTHFALALARAFFSPSLFVSLASALGWLRLVRSLKLWGSLAKEPYKRDYILQKRPTILRSLLIVATPAFSVSRKCSPYIDMIHMHICTHMYVSYTHVYMCT